MTTPSVVLGSGSPRRRELLASRLVEPRVVSPDVDETPKSDETPIEYVRRLAAAKLDVVLGRVGQSAVGTIVIAADTTVDVDGRIVGKPADVDDARRILARLSGRTHFVHTGLAVAVAVPGCRGSDWEGHVEVDTAAVTFRPLDTDEIDAYVASGEPLDKAGAYGIQGPARDFVERVEGLVSTVVGLPIERLDEIVAGLGGRWPGA